MAAPLLWLGAACVTAYLGDEINKQYLKNQKVVGEFPGENNFTVTPINGSIVCCKIYGVLEHTGIWVDGRIYELSGQGLVRSLSVERFLDNRSGHTVYLACDRFKKPLSSLRAYETAKNLLYTMRNYHLTEENCHKFVAECFSKEGNDVSSFSDLNAFISQFFNERIHWYKIISL